MASRPSPSAASRVLEQKRAGWRNPKHAKDWPASLERHALPRIGDRSVSKVTSADLLEILNPIWHHKPETARRLRQRINAVMQWAVAMEFRNDNPCDRVGATLGRQRDVVQHMAALPHAEVAEALETVHASGATTAAKLAFEFLVLTAARSGEVRMAQWTEIEFDAAMWTVPAERMKANREHEVPLSPRAIEILDAARALADDSGLVFPSRRGKPLSDMTLSKLLKEQGIPAVPHGFRSSFRTGRRRNQSPQRGRRGGARASDQGQGGGRVREIDPLRASSLADERLELVPLRRTTHQHRASDEARRRVIPDSWAAPNRGGRVGPTSGP